MVILRASLSLFGCPSFVTAAFLYHTEKLIYTVEIALVLFYIMISQVLNVYLNFFTLTERGVSLVLLT